MLPVVTTLRALSKTPACQSARARLDARTLRMPRLPGRGRAYYGVQLDWRHESPLTYARRLGHVPAIYGEYAAFPITPATESKLTREAQEARRLGAALMLSVMPQGGLGTVTPASASRFACSIRTLTQTTGVLVRFAQEMNGSWAPWGQQPHAFVTAFRMVADAIHSIAPRASLAWAPNEGTNYPWPGGVRSPRPGTLEFRQLDTDHDGDLDARDDPYAPYYPGNRYVDWVGLTVDHWGYVWPWDRNVVPEAGSFVAKIEGAYDGSSGDWRSIPNFYARYAVADHKPFMIAETSALYLPEVKSGASDLAIKRAWWRQVLGSHVVSEFPDLKAIMWFEYDKVEGNGEYISWSVMRSARLVRAFRRDLPRWLKWAPAF